MQLTCCQHFSHSLQINVVWTFLASLYDKFMQVKWIHWPYLTQAIILADFFSCKLYNRLFWIGLNFLPGTFVFWIQLPSLLLVKNEKEVIELLTIITVDILDTHSRMHLCDHNEVTEIQNDDQNTSYL